MDSNTGKASRNLNSLVVPSFGWQAVAVKLLISLGSAAVYVAAFLSMTDSSNLSQVLMLSAFPVIITSALFGLYGGLVSSLTMLLLDALLLSSIGKAGWEVILVDNIGLSISLIVIGIFVGLSRDLWGQLRNQGSQLSQERERLTDLLAAQRSYETQLNQAKEIAALANRSKHTFLSNMSHELRTPLNSIIGYTDLLLQGVYGDLSDRQLERLDKVKRNGRVLLETINDILDLAAIETGEMLLEFESVAVTRVIDECMHMLAREAEEKSLAVITHVPEGMLPMQVDRIRIVQVLHNIVNNAIKFTEPHGKITIEARVLTGLKDLKSMPALTPSHEVSGTWVLLSVADTGIGIPFEEQPFIFDEFLQVDMSLTRDKGGSGLGLPISRRLVSMMGGHIWVNSLPGKGSTFYILLPAK